MKAKIKPNAFLWFQKNTFYDEEGYRKLDWIKSKQIFNQIAGLFDTIDEQLQISNNIRRR